MLKTIIIRALERNLDLFFSTLAVDLNEYRLCTSNRWWQWDRKQCIAVSRRAYRENSVNLINSFPAYNRVWETKTNRNSFYLTSGPHLAFFYTVVLNVLFMLYFIPPFSKSCSIQIFHGWTNFIILTNTWQHKRVKLTEYFLIRHEKIYLMIKQRMIKAKCNIGKWTMKATAHFWV